MTLQERFDAKVQRGSKNECWPWTGATRGNGYGAIKVDGKVRDAHRVSHELHNGVIPDGALVIHSCDNRICVNPAHLTIGTYFENHKDAIAKGRVKPWRPSRTEPLTAAQLRKIRSEYRNGVSKKALCRKYNVALTSMTRLLNPN